MEETVKAEIKIHTALGLSVHCRTHRYPCTTMTETFVQASHTFADISEGKKKKKQKNPSDNTTMWSSGSISHIPVYTLIRAMETSISHFKTVQTQ